MDNSSVEIVVSDIVTLDVDAIVNAANGALSGGGGVDGAIHRAAGPELAQACRKLGRCATGDAVITPGFSLKARFVIHAVGPVWQGGHANEDALLAQTYASALRIAVVHAQITTIALPSISTGAYRFPKNTSAEIALREMQKALPHLDRIVVCLFSDGDLRIYRDVAARLAINAQVRDTST